MPSAVLDSTVLISAFLAQRGVSNEILLETFFASCEADPEATGLPASVPREFYDYLPCGILAHGFLRLGGDPCKHARLLAFRGKRRGFCPSCAARRMAQTAAHLVECVMPWVPTRQWVVSVPIPWRYWTASSKDLTAKVHTIIRTTISKYYMESLGPGIPQPPPYLPVPLHGHRHQLPDHLRVVTQPMLGGLHHEYRLAKVA